jgi:protein SCO1/2
MIVRRALVIAATVAAGLLAGIVAAWLGAREAPESGAPTGGDFTLQSADGPLSLAGLRGRVVLIYFGYAACPDVCPTSLALTAQALAMLESDELARVRVLFVSVDPERDTPPLLKQYAGHFHRNITGITGSPEALAELAPRYGVAYRKQAVESAAKYVVDHTSVTSVVGPDGRLVEQLLHGAQPGEIVQAIRRLLKS